MALAFHIQRKLRDRMKNRKAAGKIGTRTVDLIRGHGAKRQGMSPCACPHVLSTPEWETWFKGWFYAR